MTVFNVNGLPFNSFRGGAFDPLRKRTRGEMDYTRLIEFYITHCTETNPSTGKKWTLAQMADENGQTFNRMRYVDEKLVGNNPDLWKQKIARKTSAKLAKLQGTFETRYVNKKLRKVSVPTMMKLVAEIEELKVSLEELEV